MQNTNEYGKKKKINLIVIAVLLLLLIGGAIGLSCYLTNGFKPTNKNVSNAIITEKYGKFELTSNTKFANARNGGVFFASGTNFSNYKDLILDNYYKTDTSYETRFPKEDSILVFDLGECADYYTYKSKITTTLYGKETNFYLFENDTLIYDTAIEQLPAEKRLVEISIYNVKTNAEQSISSMISFCGDYFETEFTIDNNTQIAPCINVINSDKNIPLSILIINTIISVLE